MSADDFDFLHGTWRIDHRRLKEWLTGCDDWETFSTEMTSRPVLGGAGSMDEGAFPADGYHAIALRLHDAGSGQWSIYWITTRSSAIDPPVTGGFRDGTGTFYGPDTHNGIPVLVRFLWSDIKPDSCRWAQAFSADDGRTWETNWVMDLTRRPAEPRSAGGAARAPR